MEEEKKESESVQVVHKKINLTEKLRENPWMLVSLILGVLSLVLFISAFSGNLTGNVVSADKAGENLLEFYKSMGIENLTIDSITEISGLYEVVFSYKGNLIPIYVTKDGKTFTESLTSLESESSSTETTSTKEVPKSDKPSVELYVFAYCPYGLQMEKAMIPVVKLLGDKINFKIRYIGAMHDRCEIDGKVDYSKANKQQCESAKGIWNTLESTEAQRQLCVEKNYPTKYLDYLLAFAEDTSIGNCDGDATCLAPLLKSLMTKLGIDSSKIDSCMTSDGVTMYNAEVSNANSKGVSGSPTLISKGNNLHSLQRRALRLFYNIKHSICISRIWKFNKFFFKQFSKLLINCICLIPKYF